MAINEKLIRALYKEFDPNLSANKVEAQIRFINRTYTSQDKFVEDFYSQYETELTPKIKKNISIYFGGFKPDVKPTIDVDDIDILFIYKIFFLNVIEFIICFNCLICNN